MKYTFDPRKDGAIALLLAGFTFIVYCLTLAPGVVSLNDDTLEFQLVAVRGAIPHPSGYPLFAILLTLFTHLFPFGEMAWRANLLSAIFGAIAVGFTFLAARQLFVYGMPRLAAVAVAGLFAFTPTFWSQATVAEVYTLHIAIMAALVWRVLVWMNNDWRNPLPPDVLFLMGLGLAHHRMIVLWFPAIVVAWVGLFLRKAWRKKKGLSLPNPKQIVIGIVAFALPLSLYVWLPLRREVGSIDGTYQQVGFTCWVTACQYTAFFSENPLERERPPLFFLQLTLEELGFTGWRFAGVLVLIWGVWTWCFQRTPPLKTLFLGAGLATHVIFGIAYRVPDPEVFWIPVLWILLFFVGVGFTAFWNSDQRAVSQKDVSPLPFWVRHGHKLWTYVMLSMVVSGLGKWETIDRSHLTGDPTLNGVPFNGHDVLNQPLPPNGVVVGLLGETTYVRYLQEAEGVAPQVQMAGGDDPTQRLAAVEAAFVVGSRPYLTRELAGLANRYSLSALGSLIEVLESPRTNVPEGIFPLEQPVTESITLAGWTLSPIANSEMHRLTVAWRVLQPIAENLQVSARVVTDGDVLACEQCQVDRPPVRNAYPTTFWREGEIILDTYELPAPPDGSRYLLIFYLSDTGAEVGRATIIP